MGTRSRPRALIRGKEEVLAHLFVLLANQLLSVGQRQHGQRDLCGTLPGKLAERIEGKVMCVQKTENRVRSDIVSLGANSECWRRGLVPIIREGVGEA